MMDKKPLVCVTDPIANILNPSYTMIGVGYVYDPYTTDANYWTQVFMS